MIMKAVTTFLLLLISVSGYSIDRSKLQKSSAIHWSGKSHKVIDKLWINNAGGNCITLTNCDNIIIRYNVLENCGGLGIYISGGSNITVFNNFIQQVSSGIYVTGGQGGMKIIFNDLKNMLGPFPRGQLAQFNQCNGPDNLISFNTLLNVMGESYSEDNISLFMSNGQPSSPIMVEGNYMIGGGPSASGGGIMLSDNGLVTSECIINMLSSSSLLEHTL